MRELAGLAGPRRHRRLDRDHRCPARCTSRSCGRSCRRSTSSRAAVPLPRARRRRPCATGSRSANMIQDQLVDRLRRGERPHGDRGARSTASSTTSTQQLGAETVDAELKKRDLTRTDLTTLARRVLLVQQVQEAVVEERARRRASSAAVRAGHPAVHDGRCPAHPGRHRGRGTGRLPAGHSARRDPEDLRGSRQGRLERRFRGQERRCARPGAGEPVRARVRGCGCGARARTRSPSRCRPSSAGT